MRNFLWVNVMQMTNLSFFFKNVFVGGRDTVIGRHEPG